MSPREALVPVLKLAGTAAIMAAAYTFGSKAVVAAAHKQHGRPAASKTAKTNKTKSGADEKKSSEVVANAMEQKAAGIAPPAVAIPRSSLVVAMLLQDSFLLLSVFGVLVMALAVLVSVVVVALNDKVASVEELPMFAPLMCVGMALVALGMLSSMLRPSPAKRSVNQQPTVARCPFSGATATLPPRKKAAVDGESEEEEDETVDGEKRVSRCPFGFG